jgi:hypothetical protein
MDNDASSAAGLNVWTARTSEAPSAPCSTERRWTRRVFTRRSTAVIVGASALLGRLVAFVPTALAVDYDCVGLFGIQKSCYGGWSNFESCCNAAVVGTLWCCCDCASGECNPPLARAHAIFFESECCCNA